MFQINHEFVNLGIAVGLDDGLIVPVVHGADKMSLSEFVVASKDVIKKAQAGKLKAAEMSGSTFSITNLGMFGTKSFNPIINQPNSSYLHRERQEQSSHHRDQRQYRD